MSKIFCDPVHGQISLHPVCVAIMDTPEFQRLRNIKQTGLLEYVYPGATHNRFGHSLGVCYLAGKFMRQINEQQPELGITPTDILCVEIAGLCHDLGHGPLSHLWENFVNLHCKKMNCDKMWNHERVSQNLFEYLLCKNQLIPELYKHGIGPSEIKMIKSIIGGDEPMAREKTFMHEIVNNERSGLDVDKWDYFLRDCHYLGLTCNFQYERLMQFAKVLTIDGMRRICFRDKVLDGVYNVFRMRSTLHKTAYQHRVNKMLDVMFCDAMLLADGKVTGPSGEKLFFWQWSMAAAFSEGEQLNDALEKYCLLTENLVFSSLKHSPLPQVSKLISAIEKRSCNCCGIYAHIKCKISPFIIEKQEIYDGMKRLLPSVNAKILDKITTFSASKTPKLDMKCINKTPVTIDDIEIQVLSINWGKKEKNPVQFVHFYSKGEPSVKKHMNHEESVGLLLPKSFEEIQIHVICRRSDFYAVQATKKCFEKFWQQVSSSRL